ncbi:MAG: GatB/YqeY domain-containing protein [Alphaproteobacteria bacterium]
MAGTLRDQLHERLREANHNGDACAAATMRLILTAVRDRDHSAAEQGRGAIGDDEIRAMLAEMVAQRRQEIARCESCGQLVMAEREGREIAVIEQFLPRPLNAAETAAVVDAAIAETDAQDLRDAGRVVAKLKERYRGQLDFQKAKRLITERLH